MDRSAEFLELFLKHQTDIKAFIGSVVHDRNARDDVFQDVVLTLWQQISTYDRQRSFGAWARGIAANKVLQLRAQNARFPLDLPAELLQSVLAEFDRAEEESPPDATALRECMDRLPPHARRLLALRYESDLACEEIARHMNRTVNAIYLALSRIRGQLEACIRQRRGESTGVLPDVSRADG